MPTKKLSLEDQLRAVAVDGGAGKSQADRALNRKPRGRKAATGTTGKTVSAYIHEEELEIANKLLDKLGASMGANKSHLLRAGLRALDKLSKAELVRLVERMQATDGRRK